MQDESLPLQEKSNTQPFNMLELLSLGILRILQIAEISNNPRDQLILFHMGAKWVPGGFIGVDVFFVISGYLITSIILKDYDRGLFKFTHFWLRRIRRILPALLVMLLTTSIAGYFICYGQDVHDLGRQGVSALLSFANIYLWRLAGNYWGQQAENSVFLHTWSLSVEEQFYLFVPFLLIVLLKFYKKQLVASIATLVIISFLLFLYGSHGFCQMLPFTFFRQGRGNLEVAAYWQL